MTKPFDPTKPVQFHDGREWPKVRVLSERLSDGSLACEWTFESGDVHIAKRCADGRHYPNTDSENDLVNVPETIVRWVNYYAGDFTHAYETETEADAGAAAGRIGKAIRIEFKDE